MFVNQYSVLDRAKWAGWVGFGSSQSGCKLKTCHFKLKRGSGQASCESGWVGLTRIFHMKFFFIKKKCIYVTN